MKLKLLCCEVMYREVCLLAAQSPNTCDIEFLPKGLHDLGVERMRARLQDRVLAVPEGCYDAIILVYGLCNNGLVGVRSPHTRLIVPRAHDCIALFMGDRHAYLEYFNAHPGTYYRTTGWIERNDDEGSGEAGVSQKLGLFLQRDELVHKYGEENADYILETMGDGTANYDRLAFIRMGLDSEDAFEDAARHEAEEKGWTFATINGSLALLRKLVNGNWDDDILVVEPGQTLRATHDDAVIGAEPLA